MQDTIQPASVNHNPDGTITGRSEESIENNGRTDSSRLNPKNKTTKVRKNDRTVRKAKRASQGSASSVVGSARSEPDQCTETPEKGSACSKSTAKKLSRTAAQLLPIQAPPYIAPQAERDEFDDDDPQFDGTEEADAYTEDNRLNPPSSPGNHANPAQTQYPVTVAGTMKDLRENDGGGIWVPRLVRKITENGDQAIVLSQTLYWFDNDRRGNQRAGTFRNGRYWFYKTHEEFGEEIGLSAARVKVCLNALKRLGFIEIDHFLAKGMRTTHVSLNLMTVREALAGSYQEWKNTGQQDLNSRSA